MRVLVKAEAFETITRNDEIMALRAAFASKIQQIRGSGKLVEGGIFADDRGGAFILDVASHTELFDLLAPEIVDAMRVECRPLVSFDDLFDMFSKHGAGGS